MEYLIYRVKIDRRYKTGFAPCSFEYIDKAQSYSEATELAKSHKENGFAVGIQEITTY